MPFIRSNRLSGTSVVEPEVDRRGVVHADVDAAELFDGLATAAATESPSRMSPTIGSACPPASSISLAAV
jgi:hypothetical protein